MRNSKTSALPTNHMSGLDGVRPLSELSTPLSFQTHLIPTLFLDL